MAHSVLLNIDLLYIIFDNFEYQDDLFNGLLVNSYWTSVIVGKLWKKPIWKSPSVFRKFIRTLRNPTTSFEYNLMIQYLIFSSYSPFHIEISIPAVDIKLIAERCNNVKHITFARSFSADTISMFLEHSPGLISSVISGQNLSTLSRAIQPIRNGNCSKLQYLELKNWKSEWMQFDILRDIGKQCPMLTTLLISSSLVTNLLASVIVASFPNLQTFTCSTITGSGFTILMSGCPKLKSLSLEFPYISIETAMNIASEFPPLESFSLRISSYRGFDHFTKLWVHSQHHLRHIELNFARGLSDDSFLPIAQYCHQLESIELRTCTNLTDISVSTLAKYRNINLRKFTIMHCNQITDVGISELSQHCPNLCKVSMIGCLNITHVSLSMIVQNCQGLVEFAFTSRPRMTPTVILTLVQFKRYMLEILDIRSDDMATADVTVKQPYPKFDLALMEKLAITCPHIRFLGLNFNMVGLNSDDLISVMHKFQNLEQLDISNKEFKKEHIKELETHRRLKEVRFIGSYALDQDAKLYLAYRKSKVKCQGPFIMFN
ncbi:19573_t:CDS:2 [Cetraspora pellucida]|uniref:19573_t:CDS:1 n=1 Tax=Cetraspora pellucida TaxID=1433469 RepID=A0A9N9HJ81_9GLOM|nr:19573_t:CDS:2 [Cetraspora pellucida]